MKGILCPWIGRINIVKMSIIPKSNLQIQCNPNQNSNGIFQRIEQTFLKFVWNYERLQIAKQS